MQRSIGRVALAINYKGLPDIELRQPFVVVTLIEDYSHSIVALGFGERS